MELRRNGIRKWGSVPAWIGFKELAALAVLLEGNEVVEWVPIDSTEMVVALGTEIGPGFEYPRGSRWSVEFAPPPHQSTIVLSVSR